MIDLLREFGPAVTAIAFFLWRDWKREERFSLVNETLNAFIRTEFANTLRENTKATMANSELLESMATAVTVNSGTVVKNSEVTMQMVAHCKAKLA